MKNLTLILITSLLLIACSNTRIKLGGENLQNIEVSKESLFPEGFAYDKKSKKMYLSSFRSGEIYQIDNDGQTHLFAKDKRLYSVLGIRVDSKRNRLLAVTGDIGASTKRYPKGKKKISSISNI